MAVRPGGRPEPGDEWVAYGGDTMSYGGDPVAYGTGHGAFGPGAAGGAEAGYEPGHGLFGPGAEGYDTLPQGVVAPEALGYAERYRAEPPGPDHEAAEAYSTTWEFEEGLARLLQTAAPEPVAPRIPRQRYAHRRRPRRLTGLLRRIRRPARGPLPWLKLISLLMAALTAVIVAVVGALSGVISYDPLRRLAVPGVTDALAGWWPLLVYGPWLVAALSILRAAVHRRRAAHSWAVVVVFSAIAVYLCVARAGHSPIRLAVAGLPPITALVCFHQLVRQITLTSPPRNGSRRPRHTVRRD